MNFWCKLFNIILSIWERAVEGVGFALKTAGTVLVDTVGGVVGAVGEELGSLFGISPGLALWLLVGGGVLYLVSKDDDKKQKVVVTPATPLQQYSSQGDPEWQPQ